MLSHFRHVYLLHSQARKLHVAVSMQYFASQATHNDFLECLHTSVLLVLPFYPKRQGFEIRPAVEPHARPA
jgi:hypothetical protein